MFVMLTIFMYLFDDDEFVDRIIMIYDTEKH